MLGEGNFFTFSFFVSLSVGENSFFTRLFCFYRIGALKNPQP